MVIVREPRTELREETQVYEIQVTTPMKGMFQHSDKLWKELSKWVAERSVKPIGPYYLRFRTIDMAGNMDISMGVPVETNSAGNSRVVAHVLPRGTYASLVFTGHGLVANKVLLGWIQDHHLVLDRWDEPHGDAFSCRCETFLTDRTLQPLKKKWEIEISMKLK